jgi:hypothetical protein
MGSDAPARIRRARRRARGGPALGLALALLAAVLTAPRALAQIAPPPDDFSIPDVLQIAITGRDVLALDARSGGQRSTRLGIDEKVLWTGARGRVGVVLTDHRLLAVSTVSASWQEKTWQRAERPPADVVLGARVAVAASDVRAFGFDGGSGRIVEKDLGPREVVWAVNAGDNVGVVVTDRRALAVSAATGGFYPVHIRVSERLEGVSALASVVTLTLNDRLLIFRAFTRTWEERDRDLEDQR